MKKTYRVWYTPYGLKDESDYIDITAESEKEAREFAATCGWVEDVEII